MKGSMDSYTDDFTIATIYSPNKPGITVNPLSANEIHFGLRVRVSCRIVGNDADNLTGETFLLVSDEINTVRTTDDFQQIVSDIYNIEKQIRVLSNAIACNQDLVQKQLMYANNNTEEKVSKMSGNMDSKKSSASSSNNTMNIDKAEEIHLSLNNENENNPNDDYNIMSN